MTLASVNDVKRILRIPDSSVDTERDARLRASLAAIESLVEQWPWKIPPKGEQMEVYFDIFEDATLRLPADDVTVVRVQAFGGAGDDNAIDLLSGGVGYEQTDNGDLILRPSHSLEPFEGAAGSRFNSIYSRVEVTYIGTGIVPVAVTEGVALLAAGHYKDGPRALSGLTSEKIGDYSYTLGDAPKGGDPDQGFVGRAMWFLKPFLKKARVSVI